MGALTLHKCFGCLSGQLPQMKSRSREITYVDQFFEISENYIHIIHKESFLQRSDIV